MFPRVFTLVYVLYIIPSTDPCVCVPGECVQSGVTGALWSDTTVQPSGKSLFTVTGNANATISFTLFGHSIEVALNRLKVKYFVHFNFMRF